MVQVHKRYDVMPDKISVRKKNEVYLQVDTEPSIAQELNDHFSFEVPGAKFHPLYKSRMWDGRVRLFSMFTKELYIGLKDYLEQFAKERDYIFDDSQYEKTADGCTLDEVTAFVKSLNIASKGQPLEIRDYQILNQALSFFVSIAAEKLRKSGQMAKSISVFIRTNPFSKNLNQYGNSTNITLNYPTDSTPILLSAVSTALQNIYKPDFSYKKAGILLNDFCPKTNQAFDLFDKPQLRKMSSKLMNVMDKINNSYGRRTIFYASSGTTQQWLPKSSMRSASYTSNWDELILAR